MGKLRLSLACGPYDRTQALRDGRVQPEGIELTYLAMQPAEIFWRMLQYKEFDISEMSMSNYISLVGRGNAPFIAIPVFPSRVFRHGFIFVNKNKGIRDAADLAGKRIGVPEYSQTAAVYIRGFLEHDHGVSAAQVEWVQGRASRMGIEPPQGVRIVQAPTGSDLGEMLESGEIDALVAANIPDCFRRAVPHIARLFPNYRDVEREYYKRTKIYPIMHTVVIRREIYERDPWIALSLYQAFCAAKDQCYGWLQETGSPKVSLAWLQAILEEEREIFGNDWFPYGVESNRSSLQALLSFTHEQGLLQSPIAIEELFAPSTLRSIPLSVGQSR